MVEDNRQKVEWQRKFEAQARKATEDFRAWMAGGDLWFACGCGAHWLTPECGADCLLTHRQYPDWTFCNWPPEMLKYWEWRNWREWTPPVDYPLLAQDPLTAMLEVYKKRWPLADAPRLTDKIWNREYESKFNHRTWSEPVDYPDLSPTRFHIVLQDSNRGTVWFEAIAGREWIDRFRGALWDEILKDGKKIVITYR